MKIQAILHASFEPTGVVQNWATDHGHELIDVHPYKGERLLAQDEFDALIIMGGPQSPIEIEKYPYLHDEIAIIKETMQKGKRVLGFCLGAQLIGEAMGAKAERSPSKEIGMWPVTLTEAGCHDPMLKDFPKVFDVLHWHSDMAGIPEDAKVLAASPGCPRQIICFTAKAYGFQCHPEMTHSVLDRLARHCKDDLDTGGDYVQSADVILQHDLTDLHAKAFLFLDRFFQA
jgi:GMP synthase (glutamine-hydrolysing)